MSARAHSKYLPTNRQLEIWRHLTKKITKAEIGRHLGITRQAVHYAEEAIIPKVENALTYVAHANMLDIQHLDATRAGSGLLMDSVIARKL